MGSQSRTRLSGFHSHPAVAPASVLSYGSLTDRRGWAGESRMRLPAPASRILLCSCLSPGHLHLMLLRQHESSWTGDVGLIPGSGSSAGAGSERPVSGFSVHGGLQSMVPQGGRHD